MATAQQLFDAAVQRSNLNDPDLIPEDEILRYISSYEARVYLAAAQGNPDYFGKEGTTDARAAHDDTWSLESAPGNVAAVTKLEVSAITGTVSGVSVGDEVNIISIRNPLFALSPRAYLRGKHIYSYNDELGAADTDMVTRLKVYYSYLPSRRTDLSDVMDIPEELESLVVLPLARVLALRDQRPDEVPAIDAEFIIDWGIFLRHLGVYDEGTFRELGGVVASSPEPRG